MKTLSLSNPPKKESHNLNNTLMKVIAIYYLSHQFSLAALPSGLWEVAKGRP